MSLLDERSERELADLEARLRAMHARFERSRDPGQRAALATSIRALERERAAYAVGAFPWD